jgi:hypothetical protein
VNAKPPNASSHKRNQKDAKRYGAAQIDVRAGVYADLFDDLLVIVDPNNVGVQASEKMENLFYEPKSSVGR